jgi:SSS family solute:Na+ symporter
VGGWSGLIAGLERTDQIHLLSMVRPPDDPQLPFSGFLLGNFLIGGMFYWCMDQVNVQRVLGARTLAHGSGGAVFAGFLKIIPVFIMVLPGVIAAVLYPQIGNAHNTTYSILIQELMPRGLRGFIIAALLAALMSSLSSTYNSASTIVARDLLARFRPGTSTAAQLRAGYVALAVVMAAGVLCAPLVGLWPTIWDYLQEVTGYLSVPFAVAGLLGIFSRRINREGALAGVAVAFAAGLCLFLEKNLKWEWIKSPYLDSFLHRAFLSAVLSAATMWIVSVVTAPPPEEVRRGDFYLFARGEVALAARRPPFYADYRVWAALLFLIVTGLWIAFR